MSLIGALRDCKQRSLTVSKQAPTVSKIASPCKSVSNANTMSHLSLGLRLCLQKVRGRVLRSVSQWALKGQKLDIFETPVTVTPQQKNFKNFQFFPNSLEILNLYFWGEDVHSVSRRFSEGS